MIDFMHEIGLESEIILMYVYVRHRLYVYSFDAKSSVNLSNFPPYVH